MKLGDEVTSQRSETFEIEASSLGNADFKSDYGIKYAYLTGAMYKGIASKEMVVALGKAGLMGYLGAGGVKLEQLESDIRYIQQELPSGAVYGINLLNSHEQSDLESSTVNLFLLHGVRFIEVAAYMQVTPNIVRYRLKGVMRMVDGSIYLPNHILAKVSRPEVAAAFMAPPPEVMVRKLVESGHLTPEEAAFAPEISVAGEICVEADSGGHTDRGVAYALMPAMQRLRDDLMLHHGYKTPIRIGAAGGIGTPEAAAAAFILGADFVMTGSINQCTVEAGTSDAVKDMLQVANVQDTDYAPAGDMFEIGAKVQVLKKGLFFPARANKLYELYNKHKSIEELDEKTKKQIECRYFNRTFQDVWNETKSYYIGIGRKSEEELEKHPKAKMALIFRWYFVHATRLAASGSEAQRVDYQVQCGPAMGAFNQWVKGTALEPWRNRRVAEIGEKIMRDTAELLSKRLQSFMQKPKGSDVA